MVIDSKKCVRPTDNKVEFKTLYGEDEQGNLYIINAKEIFSIEKVGEHRDSFFKGTVMIPSSHMLLTGSLNNYVVMKQKGNFLRESIIENMENQIKNLQSSCDFLKEGLDR